MAYDKDAVNKAKKQGVFEQNVFDPKVLSMNEDEKDKMKKELNRIQKDISSDQNPKNNGDEKPLRQKKQKSDSIDVELTLWEQFLLMLLKMLGMTKSTADVKMNKAIKQIEKELAKIKPPIYNPQNKRITKIFAYKVHDLYLKLFTIRKIFGKTIDNPDQWANSSNLQKSGIEMLFEVLAGINTRELEEKFSVQGVSKTISNSESVNKAVELIEREMYTYLYGIDKGLLDGINKQYTNIL